MKTEKEETIAAYDAYGDDFDERFARYFLKLNVSSATLFLTTLTGKRILDVGAGPGHCAAFFDAAGCKTLCLDLSQAMIDRCRLKGLETVLGDMTDMDLSERFDGIWAHASLLHLRKREVHLALDRIMAHLAPHGVLFVSFKEGEGERFDAHPDFPGVRRWYARYDIEEAEALFKRFPLETLRMWKTYEADHDIFLNLLFRARP